VQFFGGEKMSEKRNVKEPRRKPKYGMLSCIAYMYRILWQNQKSLVFAAVFKVPLTLAASALSLYTPVIVLRYLELSDRFSTIALVVIGLVLANMVSSLLAALADEKSDIAQMHISLRLGTMLQCRRLDRDFFLDYDPEIKKLDQRAAKASANNHSRAVSFPIEFSTMVTVVLKFLLFSSVLSTLSPWIILLNILGCFITLPLSEWERKRSYETQDARNILMKKINYISDQLGRDFKYGKDIRLYGLKDCLSQLAKKLLNQYSAEKKKVEGRISAVQITDFLVVLLRDGLIYAWLISRAMTAGMDASQFVLYFTAVDQLAEAVGGIRWWWSCIREGALEVSDYRECMEIPDQMNRGEGVLLPDEAFSIEFKNVSFQYPMSEKKILDHVSFTLKAGEKLALVGLNGAGKTTLIRLMCGLLLPTEGEILIDGHRPQEYNRDQLYSLFGLVPQNYHLLPLSIAQNVACESDEKEIHRTKLEKCLRLAGLDDKIKQLPLGMDTPLNRQVNPDGIELSGGETQKLLLARLLYRHPRCMILDEPTAALDPIAEDQIYRQYHEITKGATAVFISHRLASTRFCDRIFLLEDAKIAEMGTHESLMAAEGRYRELFDIQSKYYKAEPGGDLAVEG